MADEERFDWKIISVVILAFFVLMIVAKYVVENQKLRFENDDLKRINDISKSNLQKLEKNMDACLKIKFADENILNYVRCINDPRKKVCKSTGSSGNPGDVGNPGDICRSRFQDCSKMRGIVEADPVAIYRMKILNEGI